MIPAAGHQQSQGPPHDLPDHTSTAFETEPVHHRSTRADQDDAGRQQDPHRDREEERQPVALRGGPVVIESGEPVGAAFHLRHREHPGDQGTDEPHDGRGRSPARPLCGGLGEELAGGPGREHLHEMLHGAADLGDVQHARQPDERDEPWDDHQHDLVGETPGVAGPIRAAEVPDDILEERARAPGRRRRQGGGEVFHEGRHAGSLPGTRSLQTSGRGFGPAR